MTNVFSAICALQQLPYLANVTIILQQDATATEEQSKYMCVVVMYTAHTISLHYPLFCQPDILVYNIRAREQNLKVDMWKSFSSAHIQMYW